MTLTIELPESVAQELQSREIPPQRVRAFVVQAIEAWLRLQSTRASDSSNEEELSPFAESAQRFVEQLVRENRELFERLAQV